MQDLLEWNGELTVDNGPIDNQHQRLFALYNKALLDQGRGLTGEQLLEELLQYALVHFLDEETAMEHWGFPEAERASHRAEHDGFFVRLAELEERPVPVLLDFIRSWLIGHIMVNDLMFAKFMRAKTALRSRLDTESE